MISTKLLQKFLNILNRLDTYNKPHSTKMSKNKEHLVLGDIRITRGYREKVEADEVWRSQNLHTNKYTPIIKELKKMGCLSEKRN